MHRQMNVNMQCTCGASTGAEVSKSLGDSRGSFLRMNLSLQVCLGCGLSSFLPSVLAPSFLPPLPPPTHVIHLCNYCSCVSMQCLAVVGIIHDNCATP